MKEELTEALQALKDKGGKAKQAAIKAEIMTDAAGQTAEAIRKGELWRIEIIARTTKERMFAASRPQFKEGGILDPRHPFRNVLPLEFINEYIHEYSKPQCSTHQVSTGEHCPEEPKHDIEGELYCDKCYNTALRMKLL